MKKLSTLLVVACTLMMSQSNAQDLRSQEYYGQVKSKISYKHARLFQRSSRDSKVKETVAKVNVHLIVNTWGEGKVIALLNLSGGMDKCIATETNFVGYQTALNTFDLYLKNSGSVPTPTNSTAYGSITITPSGTHLQLSNGLKSGVMEKAGGCVYTINADTSVVLSAGYDTNYDYED